MLWYRRHSSASSSSDGRSQVLPSADPKIEPEKQFNPIDVSSCGLNSSAGVCAGVYEPVNTSHTNTSDASNSSLPRELSGTSSSPSPSKIQGERAAASIADTRSGYPASCQTIEQMMDTLSVAELVDLEKKLILNMQRKGCTDQELSRIFQSVDANSDGVISHDEFQRWFYKRYMVRDYHPKSLEIHEGMSQSDAGGDANRPTMQQLKYGALRAALPFIGFGFADNALMILAGDFIDAKLGTILTLSTMASAGLGNTVADVLGIGLSQYIQAATDKMGIPNPKFTAAQLSMRVTRLTHTFATMFGIGLGCILGLSPLLFQNRTTDGRHAIRAAFTAIDLNQSGSVSVDEFQRGLEVLGIHVKKEEIKAAFATLGFAAEKNELNLEEFEKLVHIWRKDLREEKK